MEPKMPFHRKLLIGSLTLLIAAAGLSFLPGDSSTPSEESGVGQTVTDILDEATESESASAESPSAPAPTRTAPTPRPTPDYDYAATRPSSTGDRDCGDFSTHAQAQAFYESQGPGDPHGLDQDSDGSACETLP